MSIDLRPAVHVSQVADLTRLPFPDRSLGGIVAVHVLEHIAADRAAMSEMYRVLEPGGVAVVNVPVRLGSLTHEDPTVTLPEERLMAFGERDHVRVYGADLVDRLEACGFRVTVHRSDRIDPTVAALQGIPADEHVFECVKPEEGAS